MTTLTPPLPERPAAQSLSEHISRTLKLAWPVMLSRVGVVGFGTVDVIVLGRAGPEPLADYVLGLSLNDSLLAMLGGLLMGVGVLTARETGAGRDAAAGLILRRGLIYGCLIGLLAALLLQLAEPAFLLSGQTEARAASAGIVTATVGWALPFIALYWAAASFLEALHRPWVAMIAVALANLSNLALNIVLVFGLGPFEPMGAMGCALATVINSALLAAGLLAYTWFVLPSRARYGIRPSQSPDHAPKLPEQLKIGAFAGMSYLLEAGAFVTMSLFVGWLGTLALAAHGLAFQTLATLFMVAFGLAAATQVRVGNAWGRQDAHGMAMAGWTGLGIAAVFCSIGALICFLIPEVVLSLFTNDPAIIAAAAPVMLWVGLAIVFDGSQTVMSHSCRGRGDTWVPTLLHFGSYWCVMVPAGYLFAFTLEQGVSGIYQGIFVASIVSLSVLMLRFRSLARTLPTAA
ncbi:MATE family multidrug resistance protein [Rubricella aquisinus]|uniref:Multidrug-efflux transporter n=1 Tax=Rubricella aquisinus TaxID=2028108 RepID=A0A840WZT8_9RHOB|nr:MATE family efflux transporter [Rubricella aquisinus]MBB5515166.1 MATE family multidrug resistance protein [Rubricella aquisinus]